MTEVFIKALLLAYAATVGAQLIHVVEAGSLRDKKGDLIVRLVYAMVAVSMAAFTAWLFL